jgi:hypothetical protein
VNCRSHLLSITLSVGFFVGCASTAVRAQTGETRKLPEGDQCIACHGELDDELGTPVKLFVADVHLAAGLSCADCHGGDPTSDDPDVGMSPKKGFVGRPGPLEVPKFCNRCHGDAVFMKKYNPGLPVDQYAKYLTSVHGKLNQAGDKKAAQCASCHPAHNMKPPSDPTSSVYAVNIPSTCGHCHADSAYMAPYGIPTNQLAGYTESVHGKALLERHDLGAPACNSCHGNHGATPPLTGAIANVCGNCHAFNAELFASSPHKKAFEEGGIPACEVCHSVHKIRQLTLDNLGDGPHSVCTDCHSADDGTRGIAVAVALKNGLAGLEDEYNSADSLLGVAERKGMFVEDAQFQLKDARQSIIQANTLIHAFSDSLMHIKVDSATAVLTAVTRTADAQIGEASFRRLGLVISSLIISFVAIVLFLKIRDMERK